MKINYQRLNFSYKLVIILVVASLLIDTSFPRLAQAQSLEMTLSAPEVFTGQLPLAKERSPRRVVPVVLTAYSSTPGQTDDSPFVTSNGMSVYDGLIAANWLPYGSRVKFPGLFGSKIFTVNDRMHPRYGRGRVDLWLDAPLEEVKEFGVKRAVMEIY